MARGRWTLVSAEDTVAPRDLERWNPVRNRFTGAVEERNLPDVGGDPVKTTHYVWRHACGAIAVSTKLAEDQLGACGRCEGARP